MPRPDPRAVLRHVRGHLAALSPLQRIAAAVAVAVLAAGGVAATSAFPADDAATTVPTAVRTDDRASRNLDRVPLTPGATPPAPTTSAPTTPAPTAPARPAPATAAPKTTTAKPRTATPAGCTRYSGSKLIACQLLPSFGFSTGEMAALVPMWQHESGWSYTSYNSGSGAYGIPQALPGSKMATAGSDWRTNPATQIRWGLGYIKQRYGSPSAAWSFWQAHGWY